MPKDKAYLAAEKKIQQALQSRAWTLDLSGMELTELPESLGQLTQLTELNLSDNKLTSLPTSLGQLTRLTKLDLSSNQLTALPDSLGNLIKLQDLEIYENQLTLLPHSFGQLTKLRTLGMGKNSLVELPDSINNIKNIESLWIDNFPKFANWIRQLTKLNEIRSIECQIQFVPDWLSELKLLRILTLIRNYTVNFT